MLQTESRLEVLSSAYTLLRSDVWYSIGEPREDKILAWICRITKKPHVLHWVGSDILQLREPACRTEVDASRFSHLAEVAWTQRELRTYDVDASIAPLPPRFEVDTTAPLPDCFTVLFYLPRNRADWYGAPIASRLMRALRGEPIRYIIAGGGGLAIPPGVSAENIGWREDLRAVYKQSSVLVRFTPRDGLSLMVLEALAMGRHVIWTQDFPHVTHVRSYDEIETAVRALLKQHTARTLQLNLDGSNFVAENYAPQKCIAHIADAWQNALALSTQVGAPAVNSARE